MEEILIAAITVLGSAGVWRYFENRAKERTSSQEWIKMDCQRRIEKLEKLLQESSEEKEQLRKEILKLSKLVAELQTRIEVLDKLKK